MFYRVGTFCYTGFGAPQLINRLNNDAEVVTQDFAKNKNEPSAMVLLTYSRVSNIPLENIIDDDRAIALIEKE